MMFRFITVLGIVAYANGFSSLVAPSTSRSLVVGNNNNNNNKAAGHLYMSEPSDTSNDPFEDDNDYVTVESEPYEPTRGEAIVSNIMDLMPDTLMETSAETRSAINEAVCKLETMNPTPDPTLSPLLNGVWELRYAGGYSEDWALPSPTR